jgi:hypothetical protein
MPSIFAQMRGDAVRTGPFAFRRSCHWIRFTTFTTSITRLSKGGNVVDVYA